MNSPYMFLRLILRMFMAGDLAAKETRDLKKRLA